MSSSNNSTPSADGREAAPDSLASALESARASGVASNAFGIRDNQGVILLSLPPEGTFES